MNLRTILLSAVIAGLPGLVWADVTGADPRLTGAPGDQNCTSCHNGTALNGGGGSVKIILPGAATYTPGVKQHIQVQVSDSKQRRWGFELSARLASNPASAQAGDIASTDSNTQVRCDNGRAKPCSSSNSVQFITHTVSGTRDGTTGGVTFELDWTPPATDQGKVTLYAAGNAANGNGQPSGDHIYTTSVDLASAAVVPTPAITGVVNAASFQSGIAQSSWVTITGTNLSTNTRTWTAQETAAGTTPTSLDGVNVSINGKPAYVEYISPTQINVIAPADDSTGPVQVQVTANGQTSNPMVATLQALSPAFFTYDGKYLAATHADNSLLGKQGLFSSAPNATTPAKPGETIVLYGTGFGATDPAIPAGQITDKIANITAPYSLTVGGLPAAVTFAGLVPPFAELYQFNVQVPAAVPDGDQPVAIQIGGSTSINNSGCCFLTVQR